MDLAKKLDVGYVMMPHPPAPNELIEGVAEENIHNVGPNGPDDEDVLEPELMVEEEEMGEEVVLEMIAATQFLIPKAYDSSYSDFLFKRFIVEWSTC